MKNKKTIQELVEGFFWSIFIGVVGISIGLGALVPPLNYVAKPFVCPDGQMTFEKQVDNPTPNQTFYTADWYCQKGETTAAKAGRQPVSPFAYAGVFYGLVCFPLFLLGRSYFKKREGSLENETYKAR
jgi:hypothetical protein